LDVVVTPLVGVRGAGPTGCAARLADTRSTLRGGKGVDMADKSPRKAASKKSGKSLKEKRQAKKEKESGRRGVGG
jgi:hypothetical protein